MPKEIIKRFFACSTCKLEYKKRKDAVECESREKEPLKFKKGDDVFYTQVMNCNSCSLQTVGLPWKGKVARNRFSIGDYELYRVHGEKAEALVGKHIREYKVDMTCSGCAVNKGPGWFNSLEIQHLKEQ